MSINLNIEPLSIRVADDSDEAALARLAGRDSSRVPAGTILVAELGGVIRAALAVETGATIADPFHPTTELLALLRARADQSRRHRRRQRIAFRSHPRPLAA